MALYEDTNTDKCSQVTFIMKGFWVVCWDYLARKCFSWFCFFSFFAVFLTMPQTLLWNNKAFRLLKAKSPTGFPKEINPLYAKAGIFQRTGSIPWLLMPWLLVSPGYQQSWDWLRLINRSLSSTAKGLTHWGRGKVAAILQRTFSNAFSWMKMYKFYLTFHWSLFQLTTIQHWFRKWLGTGQATSHYLNQSWLVYWHIYVSLGLSELN